jgi:hypothetical protein
VIILILSKNPENQYKKLGKLKIKISFFTTHSLRTQEHSTQQKPKNNKNTWLRAHKQEHSKNKKKIKHKNTNNKNT